MIILKYKNTFHIKVATVSGIVANWHHDIDCTKTNTIHQL